MEGIWSTILSDLLGLFRITRLIATVSKPFKVHLRWTMKNNVTLNQMAIFQEGKGEGNSQKIRRKATIIYGLLDITSTILIGSKNNQEIIS